MHTHNKKILERQCCWLALSISPVFAASALAQDAATERTLAPITVTATRSPLDPNLPASTFSTTRDALQAQSYVNTEDALLYAPNTTVRKRFIGDRNANLGGRSFGTTQPARGLAYVDGYLISNFLGRFDAPRWSIVAPEEVARVDVMYGPFSAIYPGNSIGTTVAITTRTPSKLEAATDVGVYRQTHDDYGLKRDYSNNQQSAYVGNRWGPLALAVSLNRMAYNSQPLGYATATAAGGGIAGLPVAGGAVVDTDPSGAQRVTVGAINMQSGVQEQAKIKLAYDITPTLQVDTLFAHWRNDYRVYNQTLLHDAASGAEIWKGAGTTAVNINGTRYNLPTLAPQKGVEEHEQLGARLRTRHKKGWNYSLQISTYQVLTNSVRQSGVSDPLAAGTVGGTDTVGDGTGWNTFELQSTYTPRAGEAHALTFGYHQNNYTLKNRVFALGNWNDAGTRIPTVTGTDDSSNYFGKTEEKALYAQDAWHFLPAWTATAGLRIERFRAYDGSQFDATATAQPQVRYADRSASGVSPKLSLSHMLSDEWLVRGSVARGIRFPTVSELFQGAKSGTAIIGNDPDLKPETSDAKELAFIREAGKSSLRLSLFEDDIRNAIFQQQQIVGATSVTTVQNVKRVRTRGIEAAFQGSDVLIAGVDLEASLALTRARTLENPAYTASEGKNWPRVPRVRASVLGSYRNGPWLTSLGVRHEGRQYSTLDNSDINPDTVGAVSSFTVVDAKLGYKLGNRGRLAVGIDNLADKRYYVGPHPYPGRTIYAEARLTY
jgi:iron complex outermembrane recepter protein